jgi:hypothetical protein
MVNFISKVKKLVAARDQSRAEGSENPTEIPALMRSMGFFGTDDLP